MERSFGMEKSVGGVRLVNFHFNNKPHRHRTHQNCDTIRILKINRLAQCENFPQKKIHILVSTWLKCEKMMLMFSQCVYLRTMTKSGGRSQLIA